MAAGWGTQGDSRQKNCMPPDCDTQQLQVGGPSGAPNPPIPTGREEPTYARHGQTGERTADGAPKIMKKWRWGGGGAEMPVGAIAPH